MRVLVFPAGTEIGLEIARALRFQKNIEVVGGCSVADHSIHAYDQTIHIDDIYANPHDILRVADQFDWILPAHDQVVYHLAQMNLPNAIVPDAVVAEIIRSKSKTYDYFAGILPVPKMLLTVKDFPVFIKPDQGQGSRGARICRNRSELETRTDEIIMEYLPGPEYTVDCFTDRHGVLRYILPRERCRTNNGISVASSVASIDVGEMAGKISKSLGTRGQWFFQVKEKDGVLYLLEIAARASGTSCLARARGVNLPLLTLWDRVGDVEIIGSTYPRSVSRALENKFPPPYFNKLYIDLDDTLNYLTIAIVYKYKALGKEVILLTRNQEPELELMMRRIDPAVFDKIIVTDDKSLHITGTAILIDDSFRERRSVPCLAFDVQQAIEILL